MDKYEGKDIYCYENTNVLINKLDIRDEKELTVKERKLTTLNTIKIYKDFNIERGMEGLTEFLLICYQRDVIIT